MSATRVAKDKAMAAFLKDKGITRVTGQCPMGCGTPLHNGGKVLGVHLNVCLGPVKTRQYRSR